MMQKFKGLLYKWKILQRYCNLRLEAEVQRWGIRQALGFVFVEIYMGANELKNMPVNSDLEDMLKLSEGVQKGAERMPRKNIRDFSKFGERIYIRFSCKYNDNYLWHIFTTARIL
ncbi:MAG: hypothetical protein ACLTAI_08310 [Thomasclavelia sp.]